MAEEPLPHEYELRQHLRKLLASGESHATNTEAIDNLPPPLHDRKAEGIEHTAWQLLEHMRISQADILDFCVNPLYEPRTWPEDYWPPDDQSPSPEAWDHSRQQFFADLESMKNLIADKDQDLFARIPWGKGQTLLREALLVADHNSYHLGQIILLRKALGAWN